MNSVASLRRTSPKFPPSSWDVHLIILKEVHTIKYNSEAWSTGFEGLAAHHHPMYGRPSTPFVKSISQCDSRQCWRTSQEGKQIGHRSDFEQDVQSTDTLYAPLRGVGHASRSYFPWAANIVGFAPRRCGSLHRSSGRKSCPASRTITFDFFLFISRS